jgi:hypothetical protein
MRGFTSARNASCRRRARRLMISSDWQAGDPVIAGDVDAGGGQLVVPDDGGRSVRATRPAAPRALQSRKGIN